MKSVILLCGKEQGGQGKWREELSRTYLTLMLELLTLMSTCFLNFICRERTAEVVCLDYSLVS